VEETDIRALHWALRLERVAEKFPQELDRAEATAAAQRAALQALDDLSPEPWPPMRLP
jgi:hypothetical protein